MGNYKYGITPNWTYEIHSSLFLDQQTVGTTQYLGSGRYGVFTIDTGASQHQSKFGELIGAGYQISRNQYGVNINYQSHSSDFVELSSVSTSDDYDESEYNGRSYQTGVSLYAPLGSFATFSASMLYQSAVGSSSSYHTYTAAINANLYRGLNFYSNYQANQSDGGSWSINIGLSYSFDHSNVSNSYANSQSGSSNTLSYSSTAQLQSGQSLSAQLSNTRYLNDNEEQQSGSIYINGGQHGDYSASLYRNNDGNQLTMNANGGMVWMDKHVFFTPTIQNAFAVVDTSNLRGVGVRANGIEEGKSNANGVYIIPDLPSYVESTIGISPDIAMNLKELNDSFKVIPAYRSGELLKFDIEPIHYVLTHITGQDRTLMEL